MINISWRMDSGKLRATGNRIISFSHSPHCQETIISQEAKQIVKLLRIQDYRSWAQEMEVNSKHHQPLTPMEGCKAGDISSLLWTFNSCPLASSQLGKCAQTRFRQLPRARTGMGDLPTKALKFPSLKIIRGF